MSPSPAPGPRSARAAGERVGWVRGARIGIAAGLATAGIFGLIDALVASRHVRPNGLGGWVQCLSGSAATYALVWVPIGTAVALGARLALRGRTAGQLARWTWTATLGLALFLEIYLHSRMWILPGRPADHPGRIAAAVLYLAVALPLGGLAARLGAGIPRTVARGAWAALGVLLALGAWTLSRGFAPDPRGALNERNADLPNVLLIIVDALRADVLGPYGNTRVQTPAIDALAARGVVFEDMHVQAPFTWTSFGSMLTGKYPRRHGLVKMAPGVRMRPNVTLAWHLKQAAFVDPARGSLQPGDYVGGTFMMGTVSNGSGLMRGFDFYSEALKGHSLADNDKPWSVFRSELLLSVIANKLSQRFQDSAVNAIALDWLERYGERRFLALLHYYSTHTPYAPPAEYRELYCDPAYDGPFEKGFWSWHREAIERGEHALSEADRAQIRNLYYGGTTQADAMVGEVLAALEEQGVLDDTLVIFTSDHGEELGDHDLWEHNFMYETNLQIPMILAGPGVPRGQRVSALAESVDLVPTICELLGIEPPLDEAEGEYGRIDGVSLVPLMRGEVDGVKPYSYAENGRFISVQDQSFKLILRNQALEAGTWQDLLEQHGEPPRFFDLARDPGEFDNVFAREQAQAQALHRELKAFDATMPIPKHDVNLSQRDREAEVLSALGYTGDGIGFGIEGDGHTEPVAPEGGAGEGLE